MDGRARAPRARGERGAAAVEGATVTAFFLAPLMAGVLVYGYYFWQLQKADVLDPDVDQAGLVGTFCSNQVGNLLDRVRTAALVAAENVGSAGAPALSAADVTASVVDYVPGELGVLVDVRFSVSVVDGAAGLVPLPGGGRVTTQSQVRLENVVITGGVC